MLIFVGIILGLSASSAAEPNGNQKCIGKCMDSKCNSKCNTSTAEVLDNDWLNNYADGLESNHTADLDRLKKNHEQFPVTPLTAGQDDKNSPKFFITANRKRSIKDEWSFLDDLLISLTNIENLNDGLITEGARRSKRGLIPYEQLANAIVGLVCDPLRAIPAIGKEMDLLSDEGFPPIGEPNVGLDGDELKYSVFSKQPQYPPQEQLSQLELCCQPC
ncbi:uncharacterized protein [Rhodnius prolixus]|uniref:uncharacterized protein n=1 Tax=Rhodnius prolixus TaxID=13249 RepID=UPI003D18EBD3